ncbi:putative tRNA pseudouridine(38-40) synthase [Helianthus debilis subsp. tardiflorus]
MTPNDQQPPLITTNSPENRPESPNRPSKIAKLNLQHNEPEPQPDSEPEERETSTTMGQNPRATIQRYLIAIEYFGTRFSGAQQQAPNCRTVVGVLQSAFHKFIGQPVSIFCSSRTDAGVHALSNVCHVDVERISKRKPGEVLPPHEPSVVKKAVNHFLQKNEGDIMITDVRCVAADFHARYKAQERTYFYRLLSGPEHPSTFEKDRAWHVPEELDLQAMQKACKALVGLHDFTSFRASGCQAKSPIRNLDELNVIEVLTSPYFPSATERETQNLVGQALSESNGGLSCSNQNRAIEESNLGFGMRRRHRCFVVTARARSFLYHQVRLLVGALKSVGTGDLTVSDVERILEAKNVTANGPMAPACGLYLAHVKYDLP